MQNWKMYVELNLKFFCRFLYPWVYICLYSMHSVDHSSLRSCFISLPRPRLLLLDLRMFNSNTQCICNWRLLHHHRNRLDKLIYFDGEFRSDQIPSGTFNHVDIVKRSALATVRSRDRKYRNAEHWIWSTDSFRNENFILGTKSVL